MDFGAKVCIVEMPIESIPFLCNGNTETSLKGYQYNKVCETESTYLHGCIGNIPPSNLPHAVTISNRVLAELASESGTLAKENRKEYLEQ